MIYIEELQNSGIDLVTINENMNNKDNYSHLLCAWSSCFFFKDYLHLENKAYLSTIEINLVPQTKYYC